MDGQKNIKYVYHFISYFIRNVAASPKWSLACRNSLPVPRKLHPK